MTKNAVPQDQDIVSGSGPERSPAESASASSASEATGETPRTDAEVAKNADEMGWRRHVFVGADFARQLERELARMNQVYANACSKVVRMGVTSFGTLDEGLDKLAAIRSAIEPQTVVDKVYMAVRIRAEGSDWRRGEEALADWVTRKLATRPETLPPSDSGREGRSAIMDRAIYHRMLTNLCTMILGSSVPIGPMRRREDYPPELARAINWLKDVQDREAARRAEGGTTDG